MPRPLIVGTRGSRLALCQAETVRRSIAGVSALGIIRTSGDRFTAAPLSAQDGVGFFTKEIEEALRDGRVDIAVHSLKDLPIDLAPGLELAAILRRDPPADLLLVRPQAHDAQQQLPVRAGGIVGTCSMRRQSLLGWYRPDLQVRPLRGNVPTRLEKLARGDFDAILLSQAGLLRLHIDPRPLLAYALNPRRWVCAAGQAVIAVEVRAADRATRERVAPLDHAPTRVCVDAERALLRRFGAGCHAPFGALAEVDAAGAQLFVAAPGGDDAFRIAGFGAPSLDEAEAAAARWIADGRPEAPQPAAAQWLARRVDPSRGDRDEHDQPATF